MPKLVCQSGANAGHEYPLTKDVTILGRQSSCDVQVQDEMSSRAHCQVRRDGRLYSLVDLGSRNGTLLNNKKVSERLLSFGDIIRIGKAEYLLVKESGDLELKDLLSKYEILEKIGEGGMGIVYKANQRSMARVVALKILSPKYSSKRKFVEQFTREARAAGSLNHPNIIQVHDVGAENDIHYFSMEFVDGPTCMQVLKSQGQFPVPDALEIIRQTARALEYAHAHRLIHQDIKPDNIMLGPNNIVKLADLGISKTFDEAEVDDGLKKVMGTPHYMSPEAALGKKVDQRVDIYSLGATAYHLLSGKTPFHGSSPTEVLKHHVMDPLPPITEINAEVPPKVVALIEKMMAKKPEDRQQSAAEITEDIRQAVGNDSASEPTSGETMILRRYAKGGAAAASIPTPASLTTGSRTPGGETTTPGEGEDAVGGDLRLRLLNRILAAGIVVAALACAGIAIGNSHGKASADSKADLPPGGTTSTTQPNPSVKDPGAISPSPSPSDAAQKRHDQAAEALAALETAVGRDDADTSQLAKALDRILDDDLDPENDARAKALGGKIDQLIQHRRSLQIQANFQTLAKDVHKLADDHDYDTALNRLDAFNDRKDPVVRAAFDKLRAEIDQAKSSYRTEAMANIQQAVASKDEGRLKELRESLPAPFLNSDLEQAIVKALKDIDDHRQKDQAETVQVAAKQLGEWRFEDFNDTWTRARHEMSGTAANDFDQYRDTEQRLVAMIGALATKLKSQRAIRFHGHLQALDDPDLIDATLDEGLELIMSSGGHANLKWQILSMDDLTNVLTQVLGKDGIATYKPAIAGLSAAKKAAATSHK